MPRRIALFSLLVPDYDAALAFFTGIGFECREDTDLGGRQTLGAHCAAGRGNRNSCWHARVGARQHAAIGDQGGGRVWLFLDTDDFDRDYSRHAGQGACRLKSTPRDEPYGRVAVWARTLGATRWDLIQFTQADRSGTATL